MIEFDPSELIPESFLGLLGPSFIEAVLDDLAQAAYARWRKLASEQLRTSKADYIDAIQKPAGSPGERFISLVGVLPNLIEQGMDPYDMRDTLLGQGKGKVSKSGKRYRAIPFRHQGPATRGQHASPMGQRYGPQGDQSLAWAADGLMSEGMAAKLGKQLYKAAKKLRGTQRLRTGGRSGRTVIDMGKGLVRLPKLAPWHSTDIYAGMRRSSSPGHGQYTTFRTISEANPTGWIHPGIEPRMLHQKVEAFVEPLIARTIEIAMKRALRGVG